MSRYVPPALRNKSQASNESNSQACRTLSSKPTGTSYTLDEIHHHYFPPSGDSPSPYFTTRHSRTLHDSAATPGKLSHILLFKNANPRWESDGIIYTKSALELLPAELADRPTDTCSPNPEHDQWDEHEEPDPVIKSSTSITTSAAQASTTSASEPISTITRESTTLPPQPHLIAIYAQAPRSTNARAPFTFIGYHTITNLQFLPPRSPELICMLEQKFTMQNNRSGTPTQKSRPKEGWEKSLSFRWAVVKLSKDNDATTSLGAPKIEKLEPSLHEPDGQGRSVNDMLREMRCGSKGNDSNDLGQPSGPNQASPVSAVVSVSESALPEPGPPSTRQAPTRQPRAPPPSSTTASANPNMFGFRKNHTSKPSHDDAAPSADHLITTVKSPD